MQFFDRWRQHEYEHGIGKRLPYLTCPLHINIEEHERTARERLLHGLARRPVAFSVDLGPLQEFARRDHAIELRLIDEEVIPTVTLFAPRRARGCRDGELD